MVFWTFVQKTKKPVFEADEKFKTKNHKKQYKKPKANQKTGSKKKAVFANPGYKTLIGYYRLG